MSSGSTEEDTCSESTSDTSGESATDTSGESASDPPCTKKKSAAPHRPTTALCDVCGKVMKYANSLRAHALRHMRTTLVKPPAVPHFVPMTALCHVCGKVMRRGSSIRNHILVHKPITQSKSTVDDMIVGLCHYCGKTFRHVNDLKKHENMHTGRRPYVCDVDECRLSFTTSSNLSRHKQTHSKTTKIFPCIVCKKTFTRKWNVKTHMEQKHRVVFL